MICLEIRRLRTKSGTKDLGSYLMNFSSTPNCDVSQDPAAKIFQFQIFRHSIFWNQVLYSQIFFDFVPMVSMPKILHQLSIMSSSISMAEAGSIPKPSHGAPKCALQGDFFGVKPRDVTLKHPKIYQNLTGVIEWCILGGDQTWCKCMVILRDFPY